MNPSPNADQAELQKFSELATDWWNLQGPMKPLHQINPVRLRYIEQYVGNLRGKRALDVGCGGGILAESLARSGAQTLGIDLADTALNAARNHADNEQVRITYRSIAVETLAEEMPGQYDLVACMEMLEHVPDPNSVVAACARLVRPGGHVFFSTINRTAKAYALAIMAAEYVLKLIPRGTHDFQKFIRPSELESAARQAGLTLQDLSGMQYNPWTGQARIGGSVEVNYLMHYTRPR